MSEEKFLQLNIAFRIPEDVAKVAMELSREIAEKEDAFFVLDGYEFFPHITIYSGEFPEKNFDKMMEMLKIFFKNYSSVDMIFEKYRANMGWVAPNFICSEITKEIQVGVIEIVNILREGKIKERYKDVEYLKKMSAEELFNIKKYGYRIVMNLYHPHLTITRLKNDELAKKVANKMEWKIEKFECDRIGIFVSGDHGTCRKLIREFRLGVE